MRTEQIIYKHINDIKPYVNNPRHNDDAVKAVAASIRSFGFKVPVVITEDGEIIAGHTRHKAAKMLGMDKIPCIVAEDLTDEEVRAFRLADNKVSELATWDMEALMSELEGIDMDMGDFGFEFDQPEASLDGIQEVDVDNEVDREPISKLGQLWKLGKHRLLVGDATVPSQIGELMGGETADLYITDPPYNVAYTGATDEALTIVNDNMSDQGYFQFIKQAFQVASDAMKAGASYYIWHADTETVPVRLALKETDLMLKQVLIWNKNTFVMGRQDYHWKHEPCIYGWKKGAAHYFVDDRTQSTVFDEKKPQSNREHPTMKPVDLIAKLILNSSKQGQIVLDTFGGSGSTLIAAEQTGRICYISELDPKYADVIIRRYETLTNEKAELLSE